jgi:hypothetical protein
MVSVNFKEKSFSSYLLDWDNSSVRLKLCDDSGFLKKYKEFESCHLTLNYQDTEFHAIGILTVYNKLNNEIGIKIVEEKEDLTTFSMFVQLMQLAGIEPERIY